MPDPRPILRGPDCGDGYSTAFVRTDSGQQQVTVDLNSGDGTPSPRIVRADGTAVNVNDAFVRAYQALRVSSSVGSSTAMAACEKVKPTDETKSPWWLLIPVGSAVGSFVLDWKAYNPMSQIAGFSFGRHPVRGLMFGIREGLDLTTSWNYTALEPRLSNTTSIVSDLVYGGAGGVFGMVAVAGKAGNAADPFLSAALNAEMNVGVARGYRHLGQGWGSVAQAGAGATALLLGALAMDGKAEVAEEEAYTDASRGHYNVGGNPHEGSQFPNLRLNTIAMGANHLFLGAYRGIRYLAEGDTMSLTASLTTPPPPITVVALPGGGGLVAFGGSF